MIYAAITGATGFIGSKLVEEVEKLPGVDLVVFDRGIHDLASVDSLRPLVEGRNLIFHLAAEIVDKTRLTETNVVGTRNLLETMRKFGFKGEKIIFTSSFAVYQAHTEPSLIEEDFPTVPRNDYGISKLQAEELIKKYTGEYGLKAVIIRFSSVYGSGCLPGRQSLASTLAYQAKRGEEIEIWGTGDQKKDLVYVDDAVGALLSAAGYQPKTWEIFNICTGVGISVNQILEIFEELKGKPIKRKYVPKEEATEYWIGSNEKARRLLDWQPTIGFEEGLKALWESI